MADYAGRRSTGQERDDHVRTAAGRVPGKQTLTEMLPPPSTPVQRKVDVSAPTPVIPTGPRPTINDPFVGGVKRLAVAQSRGREEPARIHAAAQDGIAGPGSALPHLPRIQELFGRHDVSGIQAHVGGPAADAAGQMGAHAYATGNHVAFAASPDLHTAAHEAAHVVQQRGGVQLTGGVGQDEDAYEKHADQVADLVVQGKSVEAVLDRHGGGSPTAGVQRMLVGVEMETVVPVYQHGTRADHVDGYAAQGGGYDHQNIDSGLSAQIGAGFEIHIDDSKAAKRKALDLLNPGAKLQIAELIAPPANNRAKLLSNLKAAKGFLDHFASNRERNGGAYSMGWPMPASDWQPPRADEPSSAQPPAITRATMEAAFKADRDGSQGQLYHAASQVTFQGGPDSLKTISNADSWDYHVNNPAFADKPVLGQRVPRTIKKQGALVDRPRMASALDEELNSQPGDLTTRAIDVAVKIFQDALRLLVQSYAGTVKNAVSYMIRSDLGQMFQDVEPGPRQALATRLLESISKLELAALKLQPELADKVATKGGKFIKVSPMTYKLLTGQSPLEEGELSHVDGGLERAVKTHTNGDSLQLPWHVFTQWLARQVHDAVGGAASTPASTGAVSEPPTIEDSPSGPESSSDAPLATPSGVTGPLHGMRNLGLLQDDGATKQKDKPGVVFEDRAPIDLDLAQADRELPGAISERLKEVNFPADG